MKNMSLDEGERAVDGVIFTMNIFYVLHVYEVTRFQGVIEKGADSLSLHYTSTTNPVLQPFTIT